jgi:flagellar biosynthesis/type III secretory pathway protein FliH
MSEAERSLHKLSESPGFVSEAQQRADALYFSDLFLARARRSGLEEGRVEGRVEGRAAMFLELLEERFPGLPPEVAVRVQRASAPQLSVWTRRLLRAPTLADVFEGE